MSPAVCALGLVPHKPGWRIVVNCKAGDVRCPKCKGKVYDGYFLLFKGMDVTCGQCGSALIPVKSRRRECKRCGMVL